MLTCFDRPLLAGGTCIVVKPTCIVFLFLDNTCIVFWYLYCIVCMAVCVLYFYYYQVKQYLFALKYDLISYEDVENNKV